MIAQARFDLGGYLINRFARIYLVFIPALHFLAAFSWFIGVLVGGGMYWWLMQRTGAGAARADYGRR